VGRRRGRTSRSRRAHLCGTGAAPPLTGWGQFRWPVLAKRGCSILGGHAWVVRARRGARPPRGLSRPFGRSSRSASNGAGQLVRGKQRAVVVDLLGQVG